MSILILIKWKGMHLNLKLLKARRRALWYTHVTLHTCNICRQSITFCCAGKNQVLLYFCLPPYLLSLPSENEFTFRNKLFWKPQMPLPETTIGPEAWMCVYSRRLVRADPKNWTASPQSVSTVPHCSESPNGSCLACDLHANALRPLWFQG